MKKIISLLIVLAMLMVMAPAVFATADGSYENPYVYTDLSEIPAAWDLDAGQTIWIQAPAYGATATLLNADECAGISVMHPMMGMPMVIADSYGTGSATVVLDSNNAPFSGEAGDPVIFGITNQNPYVATSVGLTVTAASGSQGGGSGTADGSYENPYVYTDLSEIPIAWDLDAGQTIWIQAPAYGATATLLNADECAGISVMHPMTGMPMAIADSYGTGSATVVLDSNNAPFSGEAGDPVIFGITNQNPYVATSVGLTVAAGGNQGGGSGTADGSYENPYVYTDLSEIPAAWDLDAGQTIWIQAPAYGATATLLNADECAGISVMHPMMGMPMVIADSYGTGSATVVLDSNNAPFSGEAGDPVIFGITNQNPYVATSVGLTVSASNEGGGQGGGTGAGTGYQDDPYVIDSLDGGYLLTAGTNWNDSDVYYKYNVNEAGTIEVDVTSGVWFSVNDAYGFNWSTSGETSVDVVAGDVLYINICNTTPSTFTATVAYASSGNQGGGEGGEGGESSGPITGTANAEEDSKYVAMYTATENGTLTITVGDGTTAWVSDVMDFSSFGIIANASGTEQGYYTCDVVAGGSYGIRIYGAGDPCAAISNVPFTIEFTPSGAASGPQLEEYKVSDTQITAEGTIDVAVAADEAEVTLYNFEPGVTGQFKIELVSGNVAMALWSNNSYSKIADAENGILTVNITDPNQSYFIALAGEGTAAQLKVTKLGEAVENNYPTTNYANKDKPIKFVATAEDVTGKVDITDSKIDTAVLGKDGYYHLNSEDGEILFVDFKAEAMSLIEVWKNGSTSYAKTEGGKITEVIKYQDALAEYLKAEVKEGNYTYGNSYHPLTADLMEMLKNIGENNGWYGENGLVGKTADAWMFACVTMKDTVVPPTGDFGVIAAAVAMGMSAICGTAVIVKKKEN